MRLKKIQQAAQAVLDALDCPEAELSILMVDDAQIAVLNREYLRRHGPTNVIAFPMQAGEFSNLTPHLLGDVVISSETACREALAAGIGMHVRITQLLVHGVLHLLGYDHERSGAEARRMEQKAWELLTILAERH
jgi:probable rRNA maturation factor